MTSLPSLLAAARRGCLPARTARLTAAGAAALSCGLGGVALSSGSAGASSTPNWHSALLGGGAPLDPSPQNVEQFVTIRVQKSNQAVNFYGDWYGTCTDGQSRTFSYAAKLPLSPDGSFGGSGTVSPSKELTVAYTIQGQLTRGADGQVTASGTGHAQSAGGIGGQCTSPQVDWQARSGTTVTGSARATAGATYYGTNVSTYPLLVAVAADGTSVRQVATEFQLLCMDTKHQRHYVTDGDFTPPAAIRKDGSFGNVEHYTTHPGDNRYPPGDTAYYTAKLAGRVGSNGIAGSLTVTATLKDAKGALVANCEAIGNATKPKAGPLTFAATT